MTDLLARHALDLAVLAGAAAVTALRPRLAPYLVVPGVLLQSAATHLMTSDGLVLAGAAAGLAIDRARRRDWPTPADVPPALAVLLALDALMAASLLANRGGPAQDVAAQSTGYFASRSVLVGAVVLLAPRPAVGLRDWLAGGALGALAVGAARLLELAGLPLPAAARALSISLLGDVGDVGSWNTFATLMVAGGLMALALAIGWPGSRRATALWTTVAAVDLAAAATAQSRTVTVIVLVLLPLLAAAATGRVRRAVVAGAGATFLVVALTPAGSILDKPLLVQAARSSAAAAAPPASPLPAPAASAAPAPRSAPNAAPPFRPHPAPDVNWRAVLDRPYYRIDQVLSRPRVFARGNYVTVLVGSPASSPAVRLRVAVNGRTIGEVGTDRMQRGYEWVAVPVPDGLLTAGEDVTISLSAVGPLDSRARYVVVGGTNGVATGVTSRAYSSGRLLSGDLSSDAGVQRGLVIAFLDDQVPAMTRIQPGPQTVLDPSLRDRISLWTSAWRIFLGHPVLGAGFATYGSLHDRYADSALFFAYANAHSNYFELLADLGALGPLLLLLLLGVSGVPLVAGAARAGWRDRWPDLALAAVAATALLASLTQTWIGDSRLAMFFSLFLLLGSNEARPALIPSGIRLVRRRLGAPAAAAAAPPE
ncbi:MAG TPA: O-antigen ligase family protein [Candidatus Dormibacteraeota bacterium]|nr:O-antigen ligase family protein [Candidatus Dormibacteraeota bacterium]